MTNERKNKIKGIFGTILFHIGLLCLLLFMALRIPIAPPGGGGEGMTVNLGFDETGMGTDQRALAASAEQLPGRTISRQKPEAEEYLVQNNEEAASVQVKKPEEIKKKPEKIVPKSKPEPKPVKEAIQPESQPVNKVAPPGPEPEPKPQVNSKAIYKGKGAGSNQGGQEGLTGQPGDQGQPNGIAGAPTYKGNGGIGTGTGSGTGTGNGTGSGSGNGTGSGDGTGSGISYSLGGRGSLILHRPSYDSKEQGKVVVTIKVDKKGNVVSAVAGAKGTNVSDQTLWQLAKDAALKSKFASDPNAPDTQVGTITYNFIRQN